MKGRARSGLSLVEAFAGGRMEPHFSPFVDLVFRLHIDGNAHNTIR